MNTSTLARFVLAAALLAGLCGFQTTPDKPDAESKPSASPDAAPAYVAIKSSMGVIVLELDTVKAPISVENFLTYTENGFYDGTIFHRVIPGFMIQGGGLTANMVKKQTRPPIKNESSNGLSNARGSIAMARTNDINSATSQFFINVNDNKQLDDSSGMNMGYTVFGKVVAGMDVVDAIVSAPTGVQAGRRDVPNDTVTIEEVKQITAEEAEAVIKGGAETQPAG